MMKQRILLLMLCVDCLLSAFGQVPVSRTGKKAFTVKGVSFNMILVKGGTFTMGATSEQENDAYGEEKPTHSVTLYDYYIGETEVTQELWEAVMGSNPSYYIGANKPVESVSWDDCKNFIRKLNALTGQQFRLPTEAEWEYAARGGKKSQHFKYSGSNTLSNVSWYWQNSGNQYLHGTDSDWDPDKIRNNHCKTHSVSTKKANELGIYDMNGNVWEWCEDWFEGYSTTSQTSPKGPSRGTYHVIRGGGWSDIARYCRISFRSCLPPDAYGDGLGLRLAL